MHNPPRYLARRYFAPRYFGTGPGGKQDHAGPAIEARIFDDLVRRIQQTQAFNLVAWGGPGELLAPSADDLPACTIEPLRWDEDDRYSDAVVVTVGYQATIVARELDPAERAAEARSLAAVAANAGSGVSLAGSTMTDMTALARGKSSQPRHPEYRIVLDGAFTYLIEGIRQRGES